MLSIPASLRSRSSLPHSLRTSASLPPIQFDAHILNQNIYAFQGEVTSLDNRTWFLTHPQDRSAKYMATFSGITTGDTIEVEDLEMQRIGKRKYIWKVWGKLGRLKRLEKGYFIYKLHPYWVRFNNDEERITTQQNYQLAVPYYLARPTPIVKWVHTHYHHLLPNTLAQRPTSNPHTYTPPLRFWDQQHHPADRISWTAPSEYIEEIEKSVVRA